MTDETPKTAEDDSDQEQDLDTILLRSRRFRNDRIGDWKTLERLVRKVESGAARSLSNEDLLALPRAYRSTLSSLSVARTSSLDQNLISYLESLCTRAYFCLYGTRTKLSERIYVFLRKDWPAAVAGLWRETLASAAFMFLGALVAFLLVQSDPDWYYSFMPSSLAGDRTPSATTEMLRDTLYHDGDASGLSVFAAKLFTHNSRVAIFAFALGFAFCAPSAMLMIYNGLTLGAFVALFSSRGLGYEVVGWLLIHGVTELFAIILAGAAGIRIGWSLVFAGNKKRLQSAAQAGRQSAQVVGGVVIMLLIAGLLEGFGRQLITSDLIRYGVAGLTGVFWMAYFYGSRGRGYYG